MKKDLSYFMELKYNTILKKQNSSYFLFIPELSLIVEGNTPDDVYEKLESEKEEYFKRIIKLNVQDTVKEPAPVVLRKKLFQNLISFFGKALITLICIFIIYSFMLKSLPIITEAISQVPRATYSFGRELSTKFFVGLDNLSVEDKAEILKKIRMRLQQIKPFVDELRMFYEYDNNKRVKKGSESVDREIVNN
jgi:hypothetical protein